MVWPALVVLYGVIIDLEILQTTTARKFISMPLPLSMMRPSHDLLQHFLNLPPLMLAQLALYLTFLDTRVES